MIANRSFRVWLAALAIGGFAGGCRAMPPDRERPAPTASERAPVEAPRPNVWVTYAPGGVDSTTTPNADGTETVGVGGVRGPIISVRLLSANDGAIDAELLTPGGFHKLQIRAQDVRREDPNSDPALREAGLVAALMHNRPAVRFRIDREGEPQVRTSPELQRHEACAGRLLQADSVPRVAPPIDRAALLVGLANLSLPRFVSAYQLGLVHAPSSQQDWRSEQIGFHGQAVRSEINLLSAANSPAARLCRALAYRFISELRSDSCIIEGSIDERDGWPITLTVSRRGETPNGATERKSRSFDRVAPLQGFSPPRDPCAAG
jgi:hypothetical protein